MDLLLIGVSHRTAGVDARAQCVAAPDVLVSRLSAIVREELAAEALCLSTCNRFEVYTAVEGVVDLEARASMLFASMTGLPCAHHPGIYVLRGVDVARHAMRVTAGLDSLVLGERQILGQVKDAIAAARAAGTLGPVLDRVFNFALHTAKRVQAETELATGAVSVASAAVGAAEAVFGSLEHRCALVVGAGETGTLAARHLAKRKPARLLVANRTPERARSLSDQLGAAVLPIDAIGGALADVDVVVCATRSPEWLITTPMVQAAISARSGRPLVLVDLSVPRNIDPSVTGFDGVRLTSVDALSASVDTSVAKRRREAERGETIVEQEVAKLDEWMRALTVAPIVRQLHEHFERVRADEVQRCLEHFGPAEREHVERLTRNLIQKLLRTPTVRLRATDGLGQAGTAWSDAVCELFALPRANGGGADRGC